MARARDDRPFGLVALAVCGVCLVAVHAPLIGYGTFANVDESYATALAERLLEGHKLYDGAISQRGPLMYYTYALAAWLGGWDNVRSVRLWALLFAALHLGLVYWGGKRLGSPRAAIVATLVSGYALTLGLPTFDRFALNGEYLQLPALVLGIVLGGLAMHRDAPRRRLLFGSGLALGAAISIKQSVALHAAPILVWIAVRAWRSRERAALGSAVRDVAVTLAGLVIVPGIFVVHAAAIGTLRELYYYCVQYNVRIHVGEAGAGLTPMSFEVSGNRGYVFALGAVILAGIISLARRVLAGLRERSLSPVFRGFGTGQYLALHLAISLVSAASMRRYFAHYFILSLPILALVLGRLFDRATRRVPRRTRQSFYAGALGTLLILSALETYMLEKIDGRVAHDKMIPRLARYIELSTRPDDRLFVWGFSPWFYAYAHRRPAGRYVFSTYVTGLVPWRHDDFAGESKRVVPGSNEALLADLEREAPELVVDAGSVMLARPMRTYRLWADWLYANYCFELRVRGFDLYRRKKDGAACVPGFPQPQRALDFAGGAPEIAIPKTSDPERTRWLYVADDALPSWYPEAPTPGHVGALVDELESKQNARFGNLSVPNEAALEER